MGITQKRSVHTGKRLYVCDGCGDISPWRKGWIWYGALRDCDEDPTNVRTFCQKKCVQVFRQKQFDRGETPLPMFRGAD